MPTRVRSLLGGNTQFVIHSGHDALHLAQCKHAAMEAVACIVAHLLVAKHQWSMIHTHWQTGIDALEDAHQLYDMCSATQMACLLEVPSGQYIGAAQVHEVGSPGILSGQRRHIIVRSGAE